jgi:hypothetical protein
MVVHPNGAVVAVVEPSADVKSSWGRREQESATSGMASLLLELQLLTSVPARPASLRRPPTPRRARAPAAPHLAGPPRRVQSQRTGEEQAAALAARLEPRAGRLEPPFVPWLTPAGELEPPLPVAWSLPPFGPGDRGCGMRETDLERAR